MYVAFQMYIQHLFEFLLQYTNQIKHVFTEEKCPDSKNLPLFFSHSTGRERKGSAPGEEEAFFYSFIRHFICM